MRAVILSFVERHRVRNGRLSSDSRYGNNGCFMLPYPGEPRSTLAVIASDGMGWDHVSVSCEDRIPTWDEMNWVKDLFWNDEECVIQYHPPKSKYKNCCEFCLHLWKKQDHDWELPPAIMIA